MNNDNGLYFGTITETNDPIKANRYRANIPGLDGEQTDFWLYSISTNTANLNNYHVNDRVVLCFLNPEKTQGLILGKVPIIGGVDDISPHVNLIEQGLVLTSSFKDIAPTVIDPYPNVITTIYNKMVCLFNDTSQIAMMHSQGAMILIDKMASIFIRSKNNIQIESHATINLNILNRVKILLSKDEIRLQAFNNYIAINATMIEIKVSLSTIKMTPTAIYINGNSIFLN